MSGLRRCAGRGAPAFGLELLQCRVVPFSQCFLRGVEAIGCNFIKRGEIVQSEQSQAFIQMLHGARAVGLFLQLFAQGTSLLGNLCQVALLCPGD